MTELLSDPEMSGRRSRPESRSTSSTSAAAKGGYFVDSVHVFFLCSFAFAQPMFDLLGRNAEFFVARQLETPQILALSVFFSFLVPLPFLLVEGIAGLASEKVRQLVHNTLVGLLVSLTMLPLVKRLGSIPDAAVLMIASSVGALCAVVNYRYRPLRAGFYVAALLSAVLFFWAAFLFGTPVSKLILAGDNSRETGLVEDIPAPAPIVMVVLDEINLYSLMDDNRQINSLRFPNLSRLAGDAHWFRAATTVAQSTTYAVPSILTGNYVDQERLPTQQDYPVNIFSILQDHYTLNILESVTDMCPEGECDGEGEGNGLWGDAAAALKDLSLVYAHSIMPEAMASRLPPVDRNWINFSTDVARPSIAPSAPGSSSLPTPDEAPPDLFLRFFNTFERGNDRAFYFLHVLFPHIPWKYLPSGKTYMYPGDPLGALHGLGKGGWTDSEWEVLQAEQRYVLQVMYLDALIGQMSNRLKELDLYDRALIILVADHGVSFQPGESHRNVSDKNFAEIIPVPLIIKLPGQTEPVVSDKNVETIDIVPTILDVLGVNGEDLNLSGRSVLGTDVQQREHKFCYITGQGHKVFGRREFRPRDFDVLSRFTEDHRKIFGSSPEDVYRFGPGSKELVGKAVGEVRIGGRSDLHVKLIQPDRYESVDLGNHLVPAQVTGWVGTQSSPVEPIDLAVAINGRIEAVTKTWSVQGVRPRFAALIPERALVEGDNRVEIFEIAKTQPRLLLRVRG